MEPFNFVGSLSAGSLGVVDTSLLEDFYIALVVLWIYMFPAFISEQRKHHQHLAITVLNFTLGWTVVGWAIALVWACTNVEQFDDADQQRTVGQSQPLEGEIIMPQRAVLI